MLSERNKFIGAILLAALAGPVLAADYDLVINGGRVMDPETNYDAVANVGIKDGKIAKISKYPPAKPGALVL